MKKYMQLKKQLYETDASRKIFDDEELIALRNKILPDLQKMDIQSEEIEKFSGKFIDATKKIA
jgi:RNA polymerase primary sigma factor